MLLKIWFCGRGGLIFNRKLKVFLKVVPDKKGVQEVLWSSKNYKDSFFRESLVIITATFDLHSTKFGHQDTLKLVKSGKNFKSIIWVEQKLMEIQILSFCKLPTPYWLHFAPKSWKFDDMNIKWYVQT